MRPSPLDDGGDTEAAEGEVVHGASIIRARARGASPVLDSPRRPAPPAPEPEPARRPAGASTCTKEGVKAWGERRLPNFEGR